MSQEDSGSHGIALDFAPRTRIVFGPGRLGDLGRLAVELGGHRVLIVTDPGIAAAGHVQRAERLIGDAGLQCVRFEGVLENPSETVADQCAEFAKRERIDVIVGLGGGSSLDTAKACNFLLADRGRMRDYWGIGKVCGSMLPLIAVPTTGGTGSECQSFALISHDETHAKMACGDPKATPAVALLDPELTQTQPSRVAACTGIDALAHALESAVSRRGNLVSRMLSREAFALVADGLRRVFRDGSDMDARGKLLLGASLAGLAIENSMLGAAHAASNPLTARFGITHGQAVGWMLPPVIRFNGSDRNAAAEYEKLVRTAGADCCLSGNVAPAEALAAFVEEMLQLGGLAELPASLLAEEFELDALAAEAAGQWTAQFNPREITAVDFVALYRARLEQAAYQPAREKEDVISN